MKFQHQKLMAIILAGILGACMLLGGCGSEKEAGSQDSPKAADNVESAGTFETVDIEGTSYTEKVFGEYDLTLVNVFATWCSPCVQELPELQKLYEEMQPQGVNVVGIVMDTVDEKGNSDSEALEKAKELKEWAGLTYPLLVPDSGNLNGKLSKIQAFPTTFFVDKNGNVVSETYEGSNDLEGWKEVVQKELADLKGEK